MHGGNWYRSSMRRHMSTDSQRSDPSGGLASALGHAAQSIATLMPWAAFGVSVGISPTNARAADMQQRREGRERSASTQRRGSGGGGPNP